MHDIRAIRENPEALDQALARRNHAGVGADAVVHDPALLVQFGGPWV